jgi:seryl-tRNA synthetase
MIDIKSLRADPERYKRGAREKGINVDVERLLRIDEEIRVLTTQKEAKRAEQNRLSREIGPQIGKLRRQLKEADGSLREAVEADIRLLEERPVALKAEIQAFEHEIELLQPLWNEILLQVPQPPDIDVPRGGGPEDNVEIRRWSPEWFDPAKSFEANKGFAPRTHIELAATLGLVDFERGVKMSGTRHYVLTGNGARLHHAVLRFALDTIVGEHGFTPMYVPVLVREEMMVGTGFFPAGREQAYLIEETKRGGGHDLFLTGTGEVSLMALHADEILDAQALPLRYATLSTCFRREAGAAGKDTAGLYRIHQFEKVEQVVICRADEQESRRWHQRMIGIVESLLQRLELPYRLLQCCAADLGPKNADMIDLETWMPGRGENDPATGRPRGAYGETHSASRLYDFQCRRLNLRYRDEKGQNIVCHSLNNTVIASPRILIPILELNQNADGSVTVPQALRPYMQGCERLTPT